MHDVKNHLMINENQTLSREEYAFVIFFEQILNFHKTQCLGVIVEEYACA